MINSNTDVMGIVFPNTYDKLIPELVRERLMASIPFASRYRLIDFMLSSMVNCGISNIAVLVRENYFSLLDHLASGREWDLARKNGGLTIFPPYAERTMGLYDARIDALASIVRFLKDQKEKYVVMSDTNFAANIDFTDIIKKHIETGADVTVVYRQEEVSDNSKETNDLRKDLYYSFDMEPDGRIKKIHINPSEDGIHNLSLNMYIIEREKLVQLIKDTFVAGGKYFERDVLIPRLSELKVMGYEYTGYLSRITGIKSYFDENMKLLKDENLDALFSGNPIYTKIRDDNPTRYIGEASVTNVMVADGCVIEGTVENSILFRGVKVGKGAKVSNCILMQDTTVEEGAEMNYVITDKQVTVSAGKELKGTDSYPLFITKGKNV